jgi:hypothetical protein
MLIKQLQRRLWLELLAGACSALAGALTLVWPDWFERFFDEAPDNGDGSAEWGLALFLCALTLALFSQAWRDRRHLQQARAQALSRAPAGASIGTSPG